MARAAKKVVFEPGDYDYSKFNVGQREHGGYILNYGARKATPEQIRYYNYFTDPKTGEQYTDFKRPADAQPPKDYYSRPGYTRNRTPKPKTPKSRTPRTPKSPGLPKNITSQFPKRTNFNEFAYNATAKNRGIVFGNPGWGRSFDVNGKTLSHVEPRPFRPFTKVGKTQFGTGTESTFGAKGGRSVLTTLKGHSAFIRHLEITRHAMKIQAQNFKVAVGKRAIKVFQDSFDLQRFNSAEGTPWPSLAPFTERKRSRRGTYPKENPILREYLDLKHSIKGGFSGTKIYRVETMPIQANAAKHKKETGIWAMLHNEGIGTYGKGFGGRPPKPYVQRKFMGHSTLLDIHTDKFMGLMAKRFLFDNVFLAR